MNDLGSFPKKGFFDAIYAGEAPWDIGAPQPDLMELIEECPPRGRLLDLGCGTGDLAIGLAGLGHAVLGIDFVETAIAEARSRLSASLVRERDLVEFRVADALRASAFAGEVESAVDSGFFHLFDSATRVALSRELATALPRGGKYYMLGFAIDIPAADVPRQVTEGQIADIFSEECGWALKAMRPARFRTHGFDDIPALAVCAERMTGPLSPRR